MIAWLRWWWNVHQARRLVYIARQKGDRMATARALQTLERARILRP